ncbi:MAG: penicillin acylase family protein [Gammaproteobacteria bacterium]
MSMPGTFMHRVHLHPLLLCLVLLPLGCEATQAVTSSHVGYGAATVYLDHYGVPHIFGPTDASVIYASAWVQANADWPLVERNFLRATGRASEFLGKETLGDDYLDRALQIPLLSREEYQRESPQMRSLLDAYAAGFNDWLAAHPKRQHWLKHVEPWYTLAFLRFKYYQLEFLGYSGFHKAMEKALLNSGWPTGTQNTSAVSTAMRQDNYVSGSMVRFAENIRGPLGGTPIGSNEWAVGPSRTADGHAMLLVNPHSPWFGPDRYLEIDLHSDQGLVFSGLARFGLLLPYMGNNENLGWTFTDNYPDIGDLYVEHFDEPNHPLTYRYGKGHRTARTWTETVKVRVGDSGTVRTISEGAYAAPIKTNVGGAVSTRTVKLRFWKTDHGPIIGLDKTGHPLAVRLAKLKQGGWNDQIYAMIRSHSFKQFKQAESRLDIPYMNLMYADDKGNIWYVYNGAVPKRDPSFDYSKPVDGSNPRTTWHGYHKLSELPQVLNPKSGFLLNTNSSPMFATAGVPYTRKDFPSYMIGNEPNNFRARSSRRALEHLHHVTFDEFAHDIWNTHLALADDLIPQFQAGWAKLKKANSASLPQSLRPGAQDYKMLEYVVGQLSKWDRVARIESVPTTWFMLSAELVYAQQQSGKAGPWVFMKALSRTLDALHKRWGTIEVPWGEINRLQRPPEDDPAYFSDSLPSLPVGGAPAAVFAFYPSLQLDLSQWTAGRHYGTAGNSFVKVIDFGSQIKARSVIEFGQSADPKSPHFFDQAPLYAQRMFKRAWFTLNQVKRHAVKSYRPGGR